MLHKTLFSLALAGTLLTACSSDAVSSRSTAFGTSGPATGTGSGTTTGTGSGGAGTTTAGTDDGTDTSRNVDPATLCLTTDCGQKDVLLNLPTAENLLFTPDGRLFATGAGIFEVTKDAAGVFHLITLRTNVMNTGMALIGDVLYVGDANNQQLLAARLDTPDKMDFKVVFNFVGVEFANGIQVGLDHDLYVADFSGVPVTPSLVRLVIDPADPFHVLRQETILNPADLPIGNGLARRGSTLYITNAVPARLQQATIQADGTLGPLSTILTGPPSGVFDEVNVVGDKLLFTDNNTSQVYLTSLDGQVLLQSAPLTFVRPSSAILGRPPMFAETDILVTEQGAPMPVQNPLPTTGAPVGNVLSVFRRTH